jgi:putative flippase GtrA
MSSLRTQAGKLMTLLAKFAVTGAMASLVNYVVFIILVNGILPPVTSDVIAYASGVAFNFVLHKRFIFKMERSTRATVALYILVSLGGMGLSALLTYLLIKIPFFATYPELMKILTMGIVFFYNFFSKRFAFEKRVFSVE